MRFLPSSILSKSTMKIVVDQEFQSLIPPLSEDEFAILKNNIESDGCREPIVLWSSDDRLVIVDGHNRYRICNELEIKFDTVLYDFSGRDEVKLWIINNQFGRRNINDFQRAELALKAEPLIAARAKERMISGVKANPTANLPEGTSETRDELAALAGISARNISKAKNIIEDGAPELLEKVRSGDVSINAASNIAELPRERQAEIVARGEEEIKRAYKEITAKKQEEKQLKLAQKKEEILKATSRDISGNKPTVFEKDCIEFLDEITDESVDLLITDPPYSTDVDDIERFAENWLPVALNKIKSNGRAYICIGAYPKEIKAYLDVLHQQDKFIVDCPLIWTYRNTLGVTPKFKYNLNYQVVLHLYTEESDPLDTSITNEMFSVQDINAPDGRLGDRFHAWQKPDELAFRLIRHSTKDGDLVVDPFACTGTFLIAASKLNRSGSGCDISKDNLKIAESRGCHVIYA